MHGQLALCLSSRVTSSLVRGGHAMAMASAPCRGDSQHVGSRHSQHGAARCWLGTVAIAVVA